ncbi:4'-phosphopantetheinyl transferase [Capnocytophaga sp. HP1101]
MPLERTINVDKKTALYIWEVTEELAFLEQETPLTPEQKEAYDAISNERAKKNFLATRLLLTQLGHAPSSLYYDDYGKPFLKKKDFISISHSFDKVVVMISNKPVGVDIERKREKILRIAHKFTQWDYHTADYSIHNIIQKLTMAWCAKEVGFKIHNDPTLTLSNVKVREFFPNDKQTDIKIGNTMYKVFFILMGDFVLGYCKGEE